MGGCPRAGAPRPAPTWPRPLQPAREEEKEGAVPMAPRAARPRDGPRARRGGAGPARSRTPAPGRREAGGFARAGAPGRDPVGAAGGGGGGTWQRSSSSPGPERQRPEEPAAGGTATAAGGCASPAGPPRRTMYSAHRPPAPRPARPPAASVPGQRLALGLQGSRCRGAECRERSRWGYSSRERWRQSRGESYRARLQVGHDGRWECSRVIRVQMWVWKAGDSCGGLGAGWNRYVVIGGEGCRAILVRSMG